MTFPLTIIFCIEKFGLSRLCKGASDKLVLGMNPKPQIWESNS